MSPDAYIKDFAYQSFGRNEWSALRAAVPLPLTEDELDTLKGINENLSLDEVETIYLPLSRLLNLYAHASQRRDEVLHQFLGRLPNPGPYIISIAGSVAVGKSTTARLLQTLLQRWPQHPKVELVTTDGFLYPLAELREKGLLQKKGFPESYDIRQLLDFLRKVKSGEAASAPVYSHISYDRIDNEHQEVCQPDILIIEGLNVLQSSLDYPEAPMQPFVSDFADFSIYVDAPESLLKTWYTQRFRHLRDSAFQDPNSYFHHYAKLTDAEVDATAGTIWDGINGPNLRKNIIPTKGRANLILTKGQDHRIEKIRLRG